MSFDVYTKKIPSRDLLPTLLAAPEQFKDAWFKSGVWFDADARLNPVKIAVPLTLLCHQADTELMYGLKLRDVEPKPRTSWQELTGQLPPERHDLLALAALEGFARLRAWNVEYCQAHTLTGHHFEVLNAIAQQDALRLGELKAVLDQVAYTHSEDIPNKLVT